MADKTVKVMISLPGDLLGTLDRAAEAAGASRSAYIRDAIRLRLTHHVDRDGRRRAVETLRERLAGGTWTAEDVVRAERER